MQRVGAVVGGEGNGGVILPALHYGRDGLVGTALVLQHLAETGQRLSEVRDALPAYAMGKHKLPLTPGFDAAGALGVDLQLGDRAAAVIAHDHHRRASGGLEVGVVGHRCLLSSASRVPGRRRGHAPLSTEDYRSAIPPARR